MSFFQKTSPCKLHKPPCAACEQATQDPVSSPLPAPPPPITSRRGCPRQVDVSTQFCPHAHCAYYGRVGYGEKKDLVVVAAFKKGADEVVKRFEALHREIANLKHENRRLKFDAGPK